MSREPLAMPRRVASFASRRAFVLAAIAALSIAASSCAYYNTFYLARKYYFRATDGEQYLLDVGTSGTPGVSGTTQNFLKSIDYSKKLIANYPKSKWVDDGYLLWARALLGRDDPLKTIEMLSEFTTRYPESAIAPQARFFLGVAYRQARKYPDAIFTLNEFLETSPKHELAPYAHLERGRALMALDRPGEAAEAAGRVITLFPRSSLVTRARLARAEALFAQGEFEKAREDYRYMGAHSRDEAQRFDLLLEESDCLEAGQRFDDALGLLREAISHEREPARQDTTGGRPFVPVTSGPAERWGRLTLRIGGVHLRAGHLDEALRNYRLVIEDYPKSPLAAEAQYRVAYAYETLGDDFEHARTEYSHVRDHSTSSAFVAQAQQRFQNLERLAQYRGASGDTLERAAEQGLMRAELYLYQLDKPERALEEYQKIADAMPGTPYAGKALNARGWVLDRRFHRQAAAESLYWKVVHEYPATEAQIAARDFLEALGETVPDSLIRYPEKPVVVRDSVALTPPGATPGLGAAGDGLFAPRDSSGFFPPGIRSPRGPRGTIFPPGDPRRIGGLAGADSAAFLNPFAPVDSSRLNAPVAPPDTVRSPGSAPADTSRAPSGAPPDSSKSGKP